MATMLTHLDRQKFDQIRARWEAAQPVSVNTATMGVQKTSQMGDNSDEKVIGVSKFRRKLSHGLAFISTPLAQRRTTPGRREVSNAPLIVAAPIEQSAAVSSHEALPMPVELDGSNNITTIHQESQASPRALLRSRTTSFIPRPVRSDSNTSLSVSNSASFNIRPPVSIAQSTSRRPSKIPTPSPPPSENSRSTSPRQYIPQFQTIAANSNVGLVIPRQYPVISTGSPMLTAMRSRTTPNLANVPKSSPAKGIPVSSIAESKRSPISYSATQSLGMKENMPTDTSGQQRQTRTQTKPHPRNRFVVPTAISERNSSSQKTPQNKQQNHNSPLGMTAQTDARVVQQSPVTSKRISVIKPSASHSTSTAPKGLEGFVGEAQHAGSSPTAPPTPTPNAFACQATGKQRPTPPEVPKRRNLGTPNGLGGIWRSSRAMAASNHEVSRFSRSQSFHNFGNDPESPPPVPTVPDRYRTPSLSRFFHRPFQTSNILEQVRKVSKGMQRGNTTGTSKDSNVETSRYSDRESMFSQPSTTTSKSSPLTEYPGMIHPIPRPLIPRSHSLADQRTPSRPGIAVSHSRNGRPWTIPEFHYPDHADSELYMQVRDYMPPLYWAGRFQSIFDHWRHNAMMAELNSIPPPGGSIGQCKSSEEKMAACYIFTQLRDYCITDQAADSLWEFEYKYRREHKMLANNDYPLQPPRKQEDQAINRGALGRAVRKLTPRKSSLINLLRVKSWSKGDLAKPDDTSRQTHGTFSESP